MPDTRPRKSFGSLTDTEREQILNYKLMIYICEGTDQEKLDWFNVINTAGEKLLEQEARNAIYSCTWLTDAQKFFSTGNFPKRFAIHSGTIIPIHVTVKIISGALKNILGLKFIAAKIS